MGSFEQIRQKYVESNERLAEGIRNADTTSDITPVTAATKEEREQYSSEQLKLLDMYATTHKNLIHMYTDEKYVEERKLYEGVAKNLQEMMLWFTALEESTVLPSSKKGFRVAGESTRELSQQVADAWLTFAKSYRTQDDVEQFHKTVNNALERAKPNINKNHDTNQERYHKFELCLKGFFESLIKLSNKIGKATGFSKGETPEVSTWIKPQKTTQVLFSEAIMNLGSFFTKKMPDETASDDPAPKNDDTHGM